MATHRRPLGESRLSNHGAVIVKSRTELQVKATKSFVDHSSEVEASKKDVRCSKIDLRGKLILVVGKSQRQIGTEGCYNSTTLQRWEPG